MKDEGFAMAKGDVRAELLQQLTGVCSGIEPKRPTKGINMTTYGTRVIVKVNIGYAAGPWRAMSDLCDGRLQQAIKH